mmetsp:Transcript_140713/g.392198  ORF Transcript_140713/g.392198 Transcript_140713/m.392198 type:complete len:217 (+) Transcript_140713:154-804(+)
MSCSEHTWSSGVRSASPAMHHARKAMRFRRRSIDMGLTEPVDSRVTTPSATRCRPWLSARRAASWSRACNIQWFCTAMLCMTSSWQSSSERTSRRSAPSGRAVLFTSNLFRALLDEFRLKCVAISMRRVSLSALLLVKAVLALSLALCISHAYCCCGMLGTAFWNWPSVTSGGRVRNVSSSTSLEIQVRWWRARVAIHHRLSPTVSWPESWFRIAV